MTRPAVLVLALPDSYAARIADALRARDAYDVIAPDLALDEVDTTVVANVAAVISSLPVPPTMAGIVIELPESFELPVKITTGGLTIALAVHIDHPIEDAIDALDNLLFGADRLQVREVS